MFRFLRGLDLGSPGLGSPGSWGLGLWGLSLWGLSLWVSAVSTAHAQRYVPVNIESSPEGAVVYLDSSDSTPVGTTPLRNIRVPTGAHTLIFRLPNHEERKLPVEFKKRRETYRAELKALATIDVRAGNPAAEGATLRLDGRPVGAIPYQQTVAPGRHHIQIDKEGHAPMSQWVQLEGGQVFTLPISLNADTPPPPEGGSLRVLADVPEAVISVDGESIGESPANVERLEEGEHIVRISAEGYRDTERTVTVEKGRRKIVSVRLEAVRAPLGRLVVTSDVANANVFVDGEDHGAAPVAINEPAEGMHTIVVRAPGHDEFRTTCTIAPGGECSIRAQLAPEETPVRVAANADDAQLFVDGKLAGPVPWEGRLPVGSHRLEVRAGGYDLYAEQVHLEPSAEPRLFDVTLRETVDLSEEELAAKAVERQQQRREAISRGAAVLPADLTVVDFSVGWPYLAEFRFGIGVLDILDAGIGIRTSGRLTEFVGRAKFGWRPVPQLSLGVQTQLGGGIGPNRGATEEEVDAAMGGPVSGHPTNSFFLSAEALGTLHFSHAGAFTLWFSVDVHSDRWDWQGSDRSTLVLTENGGGFERQGLVRPRLGGSLELVITRRWNIWGLFEGILAGSGRRILGDVLGGDRSDTEMYGRVGMTYKFGI